MMTRWRSLFVTGTVALALVLVGSTQSRAQTPQNVYPDMVVDTVNVASLSHDSVLVTWTEGVPGAANTAPTFQQTPNDVELTTMDYQVGYVQTDSAISFGAASPSTMVVRAQQTQVVIDGLTAGKRYLVSVRARAGVLTDDRAAPATPVVAKADQPFVVFGNDTTGAAPMPETILERDIVVTARDMELEVEWEAPRPDSTMRTSTLTITEYQVAFDENADGSTHKVWPFALTSPIVTIDRLKNDTKYYVAVRSKNSADGWSMFDWSEAAEGTPTAPEEPPAPELAAPTGVMADGGDGMIEVSWNAVTGADSYEVSWMQVGGSATTTAMEMGTSYTIENVMNGTEYSVQVSAMMGAMKSPASAAVMVTPGAPPLPPLGTPMPTLGTPTHDSVMVSWDAVEGADSYSVNWHVADSSVSQNAHVPMGTEYTISDLMPETMYNVSVCAHRGDTDLECSSDMSFTTGVTPGPELTAPMNVMATPGDGMLMVSWDAVEHADSYTVSWTGGGVSSSATTMEMSYDIMGLMNRTAYMVTVMAMAGDTEGPASAAVSATPMPSEPVPALPLFGMLALGAGLVAAGRRRLHAQRLLK